MPDFGLIVEGPFDSPVYTNLIRRLANLNPTFHTREAFGVSGLMDNMRLYLRSLEKAVNGRPVDKAFVIRDSDGKDSEDVITSMQERLRGQQFSFPCGIKFCVAHRETESWLLADEAAISNVAQLTNRDRIPRVNQDLEQIFDAKQCLRGILTRAHLTYTPGILGKLAENANIDLMAERLPSFRIFRQQVLTCNNP